MNSNNSLIIPNNANSQHENIIYLEADVSQVDNMLSTSPQAIPDILQQLINSLDKDSEITIKIKHKSLKPKQNKPLNQNNNDNDRYLKDYYSDNEETLNIPVWQISSIITLLVALLVMVISK